MPSSSLSCPVGFRGRFLTDFAVRAAYSEGAGPLRIVPDVVAVPTDTEDLALLVRTARQQGTSVVPRGAGSGMPGGNIGRGILVDLQAFNHPLFVSARRMANVGAGVTWAELTRAASHFNLRLPPDPSSGEFCTIGGMTATNAAGARSVRYGSIRRWVRGVELVTGDGEIGWIARTGARRLQRRSYKRQQPNLLTSPPCVDRFLTTVDPSLRHNADLIGERFPSTRKNSSGYALDAYLQSGDIVDLLVGSEGTLGIITRVELDLEVQPSAVSTVLLGLRDLACLSDAVDLVGALDPSAVEFLDKSFLTLIPALPVPLAGAAAVLIVEFERPTQKAARAVAGDAVRGTRQWCAHVEAALTEGERTELWAIRHGASPALAALPDGIRSLQVIEDGCVPVQHLGTYLQEVRAAAERVGVDIVAFGHAGDGHLHINALIDSTTDGFESGLEELLQAATDSLAALGGTLSGEHGDGRLRSPLLHRIYGDRVTELFQAVKIAFDPHGILNPGVVAAGPNGSVLGDLKIGNRAASIPGHIAERLRQLERDGDWGTSKLRLADQGPLLEPDDRPPPTLG